MPRLPSAIALLLLTLLVGPGCAHYRLGTGSTPPFASLHLEPVASKVLVPQGRELLSTRLREAFIRDGRVRPANEANGAAATLQVVITDYRRDIAAVRADDTGRARKFNLTLTATCTLRENPGGRVIWDQRTLSVTREAFTDGGQLQSEYQALALLTDALAAKVVHAALDTW